MAKKLVAVEIRVWVEVDLPEDPINQDFAVMDVVAADLGSTRDALKNTEFSWTNYEKEFQ